MRQLADAEIAYVAGVLDTLGYFRVRETPDGTRLPHIAVSTPNVPLLAYLGELTGVTVFATTRTYDRHRCMQHCEEAHQHVVSRSSRWSVTGARATIVLAAIRPYVRLHADDVDELLAVGMDAPRKPVTPKKMSTLGWPNPWQDAA